MDRQILDSFGKKVAIFYHPIFRKTLEAWSPAFTSSTTNINILAFIELNVRIQKAMIYPAEIQNSMNSALTDWYQELEEITLRGSKGAMPQKPAKLTLPDVVSLLKTLPFEPCQTQEQYFAFFKEHSDHLAMKYANTLLSLTGFSKFLFDLCTSWCETLDIELFCYFLNGLFLHITTGATPKTSTLRDISKIELFTEPFYNFFKMQKSRYQRYVKNTLISFQHWCEWNYFRTKEIKGKLIENFLQVFPLGEKQRILELEKIFDGAEATIPSDLKIFDLATIMQFDSEEFWGGKNPPFEKEVTRKDSNRDSNKKVLVKPSCNLPQRKETDKISMPVIGKSLKKSVNLEIQAPVVKSIDSIDFFMDVANFMHLPCTDEIHDGLYPIWERELSECNSTISFRDYRQSTFGFTGEGTLREKSHFSKKGYRKEMNDFISVAGGSLISDERSKVSCSVEGRLIKNKSNFSENIVSDAYKHANPSKQRASNLSRGAEERTTNDPKLKMNRSFTDKLPVKADIKRGGYCFSKRKITLIPSSNKSSALFSLDVTPENTIGKSVSLQNLDSVKLQATPSLPAQFRPKKSLSRVKEEKENQQSLNKNSLKKLHRTKLEDAQNPTQQLRLPLDNLNSNSLPNSGKPLKKATQFFEEKRLDQMKLPKISLASGQNILA